MSSEVQTSRNRLFAGIAILVILLLLIILSLVLSAWQRTDVPRVGYRSPIPRLAYCSPQETGLCIVSFGQIEGGAMQVNVQLPHPYYPEILLVVNRYGVESAYECQRAEDLSPRMICSGAPQVPGEVLQFKILSRQRGRVLAEGKFSIIGIAISTPEIIPTATLVTPTGSPTATPTGRPPLGTPTPSRTTPGPSYPNPSYP